MNVTFAKSDDPRFENIEYHMLHLTCPQCNRAVQFAIQQDEQQDRHTANYLRFKCDKQQEEIRHLKLMLDKVLEIKHV